MDWKEAREQLLKEVLATRKMARKRFVQGAKGIKSGIVYKFYSAAPGSENGLARRTGKAARSWDTQTQTGADSVTVSIFSRGVPYADFSQGMFIRPKVSKWLVIPAGAGLTAGGVARYPGDKNGHGSIAQAEAALTMPNTARRSAFVFAHGSQKSSGKLSFLQKNPNTILVLARPGVRGTGLTKTKRLLFVLKKEVKRPARTAGLMPYVEEAVNKIQTRMEAAILGYRV